MEQKKLLAILGSPRKDGLLAKMLRKVAEGAEQRGYQVEWIDLYTKNIAFCKGCFACEKTGNCIQQDDMTAITSLIRESSIVVMASPTYWANVSAPVKNLFDRLKGAAMEETNTFPRPRLSGKKYILLTACHTPAPFSWICGQSKGTLKSMDEFFKTAGMKCIGRYVCTGTKDKKELPKSLVTKLSRCVR